MNAFTFYNPTKIMFGLESIKGLSSALSDYGPTVLLTYGGGSIKKNGIYNAVIEELKKADKKIIELSGIMANPRTTKVYEGIALCRQHNVDFILAVGGGSTIDCSKFIAAGAAMKDGEDFWDTYFIKGQPVQEALPFGTVLTMSATGSEMNNGGVISNWETNQKLGGRGPALFPQFSILDPTYTYSLPKEQMVYGIADMLSHLMEQYFSTPDESNVSDDLIEAVFKSIMSNASVALENPQDYIARSNLMWNATLALNGLLRLGKDEDWMTHQMEHALSAYYDIPHGAGLAIVHPMLLTYIYKDHLPRFVRFAKNIWNIDEQGKTDQEVALEGIQALRQYFHSIGAPITLKEVNIPAEALPEIAASASRFRTSYSDLQTEDILAIYQSALK